MPKTKDAFGLKKILRILANPYHEEHETALPIYDFSLAWEKDNGSSGYWYDLTVEITAKLIQHFNGYSDLKIMTVDVLKDLIIEYQALSDRIFNHIQRLDRLKSKNVDRMLSASELPVLSKAKQQIKNINWNIYEYQRINENIDSFCDALIKEVKKRVSRQIKEFSVQLGARLRKARKSQGKNQGEIAEKINVALNTYSAYERGEREPPLLLIRQLAILLDVSTDYLFGF